MGNRTRSSGNITSPGVRLHLRHRRNHDANGHRYGDTYADRHSDSDGNADFNGDLNRHCYRNLYTDRNIDAYQYPDGKHAEQHPGTGS